MTLLAWCGVALPWVCVDEEERRALSKKGHQSALDPARTSASASVSHSHTVVPKGFSITDPSDRHGEVLLPLPLSLFTSIPVL